MLGNPRANPDRCISEAKRKQFQKQFPGSLLPSSWICDPEGYLHLNTYLSINERITKFQKDTDYEIGVILIDKAKTRYSPGDFTRKVFDMWGVGDREDLNGVVLYLAIEDHEMYIATGKGAKKTVRNYYIGNIFDLMRPLLRNNQIDQAVNVAVDRIMYYATYKPPLPMRILFFFADHWFFTLLLIAAIVFIVYRIVLRIKKKREQRRLAAYRRQLDGLRAHLQDPQSARNPIFSPVCAICMEEFPETHIQRMNQYTQILEAQRRGDPPSTYPHIDWGIDTGVETLPRCGHQFHRDCISEWLQTNDSCPICRCQHPRQPPSAPDHRPYPHDDGDDDDSQHHGGDGYGGSSSSSSYKPSYYSGSFRTSSYMPPYFVAPRPLSLDDLMYMYDRPRFYYHVPFYQRRAFVNMMDSVRTIAREMQDSSSSRNDRGSFGGGHSRGGGGRGSSW